MAGTQQKPYVKLPGRGARGWIASSGYVSLWLGPDHLMQVEGNRVTEDYKRFYFKDIKAIIVRRTRIWENSNWVLFGLAVFFMGIFGMMALNNRYADRIVSLTMGVSIASFFLFIGIINLLRGPTCVCHLRTPVQQEELPSLKRLRTARKALARIREAVEAVQGPLTQDGWQEIAGLIAKYEGLPVESIPQAASPVRSIPPIPPMLPQVSSRNVRWSSALIVALFVSATTELLTVAGVRGGVTLFLNGIGHLAIGCISIVMLARLPKNAGKALAWTRVAFWGFWLIVGSVFSFIVTINYSIEHPGQQPDIMKIMQLLPESYFFAMAIAAVMYVIWAVLEIAVLVKTNRQRTPQPSAPAEVVVSTDLD